METSATPSDPLRHVPDAAQRQDAWLLDQLLRLDVHRRAVDHRSTLGTADSRLLWLLSDGRARTLREIAQDLRLEQSTVNRQANAALAAGLVARRKGEGSAGMVFNPTPEGKQALDDATDFALDCCTRGLQVLEPEERQRFLGMLRRFIAAYGIAAHADSGASGG
ncbi:MarR family winged helix-turn-helix transcriptional regulator [Kocuria sp. cx-116]|uniref:MarR family winged helix-turn-helix transcriptional regulator n=1 Tax=Kocuria sp. cx-116 TaxID=2771378 RepID=UPI001CC23BFE|nr:MarR family winged helix-turn-helix transcriptional regulator [Kocuria sp. cx-116]